MGVEAVSRQPAIEKNDARNSAPSDAAIDKRYHHSTSPDGRTNGRRQSRFSSSLFFFVRFFIIQMKTYCHSMYFHFGWGFEESHPGTRSISETTQGLGVTPQHFLWGAAKRIECQSGRDPSLSRYPPLSRILGNREKGRALKTSLLPLFSLVCIKRARARERDGHRVK